MAETLNNANLEVKINNFREKIMGSDLSAEYPIRVSNGDVLEEKEISLSDGIKVFGKIIYKFMMPLRGDKALQSILI